MQADRDLLAAPEGSFIIGIAWMEHAGVGLEIVRHGIGIVTDIPDLAGDMVAVMPCIDGNRAVIIQAVETGAIAVAFLYTTLLD